MASNHELEARVLHLYHAEKWKVGTIARDLSVHPDVVRRILEKDLAYIAHPRSRIMAIDAYRVFIADTWKKHPKLTASRLYRMCQERGYRGGSDHFRHQVANLRPAPNAEAFLRLRSFPAEQAQVDWGHFGKVRIGRAERPLMAFVMVLSWSRQIFLRFYLGAHSENFLRGHEAAFAAWGGVPRILLYDNLKSAVLDRSGDAIRYHPELLRFAGRYRFEPRAAAPYRGNEKGRVERAIRMIRSSFWSAREWRDLDDLNTQAVIWCNDEAADRPWPDDRRRRVGEVYAEERSKLMPLPKDGYPTEECREVQIAKTPYARFDRNDYSVPSQLVRKVVSVRASLQIVRIFHLEELVASHRRSFDAGLNIENPEHIQELVNQKRRARRGRGQHRLSQSVPEAPKILEILARRNETLGSAVSRFLVLLDQHGSKRLRRAMREALDRDTPHPHSVRHLLELRIEEEGIAPPLAVELPLDKRVRDLSVRPHSLEAYDELGKPASNPEQPEVHPEPPATANPPSSPPSNPRSPDTQESSDAPNQDDC